MALDCLLAVIALHLALISFVAFPLWLGLCFTGLAWVTVFFAVRELFLWHQYLRNRRLAHIGNGPDVP